MDQISATASVISIVLLLGSTVVNIFVSWRLTKLETELKDFMDAKIDKAKDEMREQMIREVDLIRRQINGHNK